MDNEITKVDWRVFDAIHSSNARDAFQKLTEQLFCYRYNMPYGVFRFYNQPYIETMPVLFDSKMIGFQSKYYDAATNLADKKAELCKAIDGAHSKYVGLNRIVFYINREFGCSTDPTQTKPEYMKAIENHGLSRGIEVEWCGLNQIETMLLAPQNKILREYFFAKEQGLQKTIANIERHSSSVLENISTSIVFQGECITLPQKKVLFEEFLKTKNKCLIIYGEGGCGKSAVMKQQIAGAEDKLRWVFRAVDFDCDSVYDFIKRYGNVDLDEMLCAFDGLENKVCIIESAEKLFQIDNQDAFREVILTFAKHGWRLIFTIRSHYKDAFINDLLQEYSIQEVSVDQLTLSDLKELEDKLNIVLPTDWRIRDLLRNLFYLNLYLSKINGIYSQTLEDFFQHIWSVVICGGKSQRNTQYINRDQFICKMVGTNASEGTYYFVPNDHDDNKTVDSLIEGGIIQYDEVIGGYFVCHDVYEEIVLQKIISRSYAKKTSTKAFYDEIGDSIVMRKAFRIWLRYRFENEAELIKAFVIETLRDCNIQPIWKDEMLTALMGEHCKLYANVIDNYLKSDNYAPLNSALRLLNTACRVLDEEQYRSFLTDEEIKSFNIYSFTKPAGSGWTYLLSFIYEHRERIPWTLIRVSLVIDVIHTWSANVRNGITTRYAGLLALYIYDRFNKRHNGILDQKRTAKVCDTIVRSAIEIKDELVIIFNGVIACGEIDYTKPYTVLCKHMLKDCLHVGAVCEAMPDLFISIAKLFWLNKADTGITDVHFRRDTAYGLREYVDSEYYPSSAFHTPLLVLLQVEPIKGMDFIIELINSATETYAKWCGITGDEDFEEIKIYMPDGSISKQIANQRLWDMYRGLSVTPYLLQCVLMAFERRLDQIISDLPELVAVKLCYQVLGKARSIAITAVIMSMVTAHPEKLFSIACTFLRTKCLALYDHSRLMAEKEAGLFLGVIPRNRIYDNERKTANNQSYRKKDFEDTILEYQINSGTLDSERFNARVEKLYRVIDEVYFPEEHLSVDERFVLYHIDLRKMKGKAVQSKPGEMLLTIESDLPRELKDIQSAHQQQAKSTQTYLQLKGWGRSRFERNQIKYEKYSEYEKKPETAYDDLMMLMKDEEAFINPISCFLYVASVLLRDFKERIDLNVIQTCQRNIIEYLIEYLNSNSIIGGEDGIEAAIAVLPSMFEDEWKDNSINNPKVLFLLLLLNEGGSRRITIDVLRKEIWNTNKMVAMQMIELFSRLHIEYKNKVKVYNGITSVSFLELHMDSIKSVFSSIIDKYSEIGGLDHKTLMRMSMMIPANEHGISFDEIIDIGKALWPRLFEYEKYGIDEEKREIELEHEYLKWLSNYMLRLSRDEQLALCETLRPYLQGSRCTNFLLTQLLLQHNEIRNNDSFWYIWNELFVTIGCILAVETTHRKRQEYYDEYWYSETDQVVKTYLFAWPYWEDGIKEWHSIGEQEAVFFERVSGEFDAHPSVLYSVAYVLNSVGYRFIDDGIRWLYCLTDRNKALKDSALPMNTEYYMEEYVQRYIRNNKANIRKKRELRKQTIAVLNFLIERGSTCAYMLREGLC